MFNRILIAYDGSPESKKALDTGIELAAALHSSATLVSVVEPLPGYLNIASTVAPTLPAELAAEHREHLEAMQSEVKQQAAAHGVEVHTMVAEGSETGEILRAARSTHADLLVVGLRRHARLVEWAGTVRRIANETPCPILAVSGH
ncbi:MAG: universal stress protein [Acidobacteriaceae bacterium]